MLELHQPNFALQANANLSQLIVLNLVLETGFAPMTCALSRRCSTAELFEGRKWRGSNSQGTKYSTVFKTVPIASRWVALPKRTT